MEMLAKILAQLVVAVLQWGAARRDFRQAIQEEMKNEAAQRAIEALEWKITAVASPDGGSSLSVRDDAKVIAVSSKTS